MSVRVSALSTNNLTITAYQRIVEAKAAGDPGFDGVTADDLPHIDKHRHIKKTQLDQVGQHLVFSCIPDTAAVFQLVPVQGFGAIVGTATLDQQAAHKRGRKQKPQWSRRTQVLKPFGEDKPINLFSIFVLNEIDVCLRADGPSSTKFKLIADRPSQRILPFFPRVFSTDTETQVEKFGGPEVNKSNSQCRALIALSAFNNGARGPVPVDSIRVFDTDSFAVVPVFAGYADKRT